MNTQYYRHFTKAEGWIRTERGIEVSVHGEAFRAEVLAGDLIRLSLSRNGLFEAKPSHAVCADTDSMRAPFETEEYKRGVRLHTGKIVLSVLFDPFLVHAHRPDGTPIFETASAKNGSPLTYGELNDSFVVERRCRREDAFFGLGEKTGGFNRRGRDFTLWNTDIFDAACAAEVKRKYPAGDARADERGTEFDPYYISIPLFYHLPHMRNEMAGFFFDNSCRAEVEFSKDETYRVRFDGGQYVEYVFAGPSMREILRSYTSLTGRMQPPPMWALGNHQCRWFAYTRESIEDLAGRHRENAIPCDVLWLDIDYMDGYRVFTWNREAFPQVEEMLDKLKQRGFRVVVIIDPGVKYEPGYTVFDEAAERHLLCRTPGKAIYAGQVWPGRTAFPDFTKRETRRWWGEQNGKMLQAGVAGIWNDMNEPTTGAVPPDAMWFADGTIPHDRCHNEYATLMAMATQEGLLAAEPNLRTFVLSRAGSPGIQRYAANWMGDNCSRWEHLWMSIPMAMGLGVSGQPFVGADIGGFLEPGSMELQLRWYQYGALTPFCRNHNATGQRDQYPWVYGESAEDICRAALEMRYRLMPYLYTRFFLAAESGDPVQMPLLFQYQEDRTSQFVDDQYLLGTDLLVAPIYRAGESARHVYLPEGTWYDLRTDAMLQGRSWHLADAPLTSIPVFARGGSIIPTWPEAPASTMGYRPAQIDLHLYIPEEDGETVSYLHEDDGVSFNWREGQYVRTRFLLSRSGGRVELSASVEGNGFPEMARERFRLIVHGSIEGDLTIDGRGESLVDGTAVFPNRGAGFSLCFAVPKPEQRRNHETRKGTFGCR